MAISRVILLSLALCFTLRAFTGMLGVFGIKLVGAERRSGVVYASTETASVLHHAATLSRLCVLTEAHVFDCAIQVVVTVILVGLSNQVFLMGCEHFVNLALTASVTDRGRRWVCLQRLQDAALVVSPVDFCLHVNPTSACSIEN